MFSLRFKPSFATLTMNTDPEHRTSSQVQLALQLLRLQPLLTQECDINHQLISIESRGTQLVGSSMLDA
jgi:hypothetical protein